MAYDIKFTPTAAEAVHRRKRGAVMKVIDLQDSELTLPEALRLADDDLIVLRRPDGTAYALSHVDAFAVEAELLKHNPEFRRLMGEYSKEETTISIEDLRRELSL